MAKFYMTAYACTFEVTATATVRTHKPFDPPIARSQGDAKRVTDMQMTLLSFVDRVARDYPFSFFATLTLVKGERAPAGFRALRWIMEKDRDTTAPVLPKEGDQSPWGRIDHAYPYGAEAVSVGTASHGGFWIAPAALARIPEAFRTTPHSPGCWFEEDCDWAIPYVFLDLAQFETDPVVATRNRDTAQATLQNWNLPAFEAWQAQEQAKAAERVALADGVAEQGLVPGVAPVAQAERDIARVLRQRDARRGAAPMPSGGLFDETAKAQQHLL